MAAYHDRPAWSLVACAWAVPPLCSPARFPEASRSVTVGEGAGDDRNAQECHRRDEVQSPLSQDAEVTVEDRWSEGEEFLRKWDAGDFRDDPDQPGVMDVAMLIPLVR